MRKKFPHLKGVKKHLNSHAREIALQGLYQLKVGQRLLEEEILPLAWLTEAPVESVQDYARTLLRGIHRNYQKQEASIERHAKKDPSQISSVISAILHIGLYELDSGELSHTIIIDDLLELVRKYDGEESVAFVNGVLDAYYQKERQRGGEKKLS